MPDPRVIGQLAFAAGFYAREVTLPGTLLRGPGKNGVLCLLRMPLLTRTVLAQQRGGK